MPTVNKALVRSRLLDAEAVTELKALTRKYYRLHNCWYFDCPYDTFLVLKGLMKYARQCAISAFPYKSCNSNKC